MMNSKNVINVTYQMSQSVTFYIVSKIWHFTCYPKYDILYVIQNMTFYMLSKIRHFTCYPKYDKYETRRGPSLWPLSRDLPCYSRSGWSQSQSLLCCLVACSKELFQMLPIQPQFLLLPVPYVQLTSLDYLPSANLPTCLLVCLSTCLLAYLPTCLLAYLPTHLYSVQLTSLHYLPYPADPPPWPPPPPPL